MSDLKMRYLKIIYKISGAAALTAGMLFLLGMIGLITSVLQPDIVTGSFPSFQNWLIIVFKLLAGFKGVQTVQLDLLNFLDIAILAIVGTMYLGLYTALRKTSKILSMIAMLQPFLGIVILIATKAAGRSGVMGAGIVIAIVMLRSNIFEKVLAYMVILASVLLFAGDISAGNISSIYIATLFGIGYVLMNIWFFLIAFRLFQLGRE